MSEYNKNPSAGKGFIYILSNPSMLNIYKVGLTTNSIKQRIQELNSTGVPKTFKLENKYEIDEKKLLAVERLSHQKLKSNELHHAKEFFEGSIDLIREAVEDSIYELTNETAIDIVGLAHQRKIENDKKIQEQNIFNNRINERLIIENKIVDAKRLNYIKSTKDDLKNNTSFVDKYIYTPIGVILIGALVIGIMFTGPIGWIFVAVVGWWIYNEDFIKPEDELINKSHQKFPYKNIEEIEKIIKSENNNSKLINKKIFLDEKIDSRYLKNWYIHKDKLINKNDQCSYLFEKTSDGKSYTTYKKGNDLFGFTVKSRNIDFIKYENQNAVVICPYCSQKCRTPIKPAIDVTCPKCKKEWRQYYEV